VEALGEASSHKQAGGGSFGGTELTHVRNPRAIVAVLLSIVLKGLGGASQEVQQPALDGEGVPETGRLLFCLD
jgi:hypothetical protein